MGFSINEEKTENNKELILTGLLNTENEKWRLLDFLDDYYAVSSLGKVFSLRNNIILKSQISNKGYEYVVIKIHGNQKAYHVHKLVALAFIPNPNNLPIVNHIDENPLNNNVNNLEWCTYFYNNTYNDVQKKRGEKIKGRTPYNKGKTTKYKNKNLLMLSKNNIVLKVFNCTSEAAHYIAEKYNKKFTTAFSKINQVIRKQSFSYLGYKWELVNKI